MAKKRKSVKVKAHAVKQKKQGFEVRAMFIGLALLIIAMPGMTNPPILNYGWNLAILFLCSAIIMLYGSIAIRLKM